MGSIEVWAYYEMAWLPSKGKDSFGVNLGCPIVTIWTFFRTCARATDSSQITLGVLVYFVANKLSFSQPGMHIVLAERGLHTALAGHKTGLPYIARGGSNFERPSTSSER